MAQCKQCGYELEDPSLFCTECGARQEANIQGDIQQDDAEQEDVEQEDVEQDGIEQGDIEQEDIEQDDTRQDGIREEAIGQTNVNEQPKKKSITKVVMILMGSILLLMLFALVGVFAYMQLSTYAIQVPDETAESYVEVNRYDILWIDDTTIEMTLEEDLINICLYELVEAQKDILSEAICIEGAVWDSKAERLCINSKWRGISIPVSFKPEIEQDDEALIISLNDMALGRKHIALPSSVIGHFESTVEEGIVIEDELFELIELDTFEVDRDEWFIAAELNQMSLNKHIRALQPYVDKRVETIYREGSQAENILVYLLEGSVEPEYSVSYLVELYREGVSLETCLALFTDEGVRYIEENYMQKIGYQIDREELDAKRTQNEEAVLDIRARELIDTLYSYLDTAYMYDYLVRNKGGLYNLLEGQMITVDFLKEMNYISTSDTQYDAFDIVYEGMYGEVGVQYTKGKAQYIMWENGNIETVEPLDVIEATTPFASHYITANDNERSKVEAAILEWYMVSDTLDIRYMKTDDQYVYAIYSYGDEWNDYYHAVLEKQQDRYAMLVTGNLYDVLYGLEEMTTDFDYRLVPTEVVSYQEDAYLTDNDYQTIKDIIARHTGSPAEQMALDYATMCNDVVYIKLVDGRRFYYFNGQDYLVELHEPNDYQIQYDANVMYDAAFPIHSLLQDDYIVGGI